MQLGSRGWLESLIDEAVKAHKPDTVSVAYSNATALSSPQSRARAYLKLMLRESGLLYGTPSLGAHQPAPDKEELLFVAVLKTLCRLALDVAWLAEASPGPRKEQLLLLFATWCWKVDEAQNIHARIERAHKEWPLPKKVWLQVESAMESRATSLAADPYYGLVLHNGAMYADAHLWARAALAYFSGYTYPKEAMERRLRFAAFQKALLCNVLVGLVCAERPPSFPARRAIVRQIDDLKLPDDLAEATREFARRAFERAPAMKRVLKDVRSEDMKQFILEQTLLASLVDGRRSEREVQWTHELGKLLGFEAAEVKAFEVSMANFYAQHRTVVDVFTLSSGAEVLGEEMVTGLSLTVQKNYRRLLKEIRKTGELSVLLSRAARGQKLSSDEKRRMRAQLIDVAKVVPALAIFAAPGGFLLLIALAKVLPFDVLPSSFYDLPEDGEEQP